MKPQYRYTIYGCLAIVLWSSLVGIARLSMESLGALGGAACLYTIGAILLTFFIGFPDRGTFNWRYLVMGSVLFASYEILYSLAFGYADTRRQAIEVSIVNYLWPALTVLFAVIFSRTHHHLLLYPSLLIAFLGVVVSLTGCHGLSIQAWMSHIGTHPSVYLMALTGAFIWAIYCNVTKHQQQKGNLITPFFIVTAAILWVKYFLTPGHTIHFNLTGMLYLGLASIIMAGGYALWNIAIIGGNMIFLATLSYFTPVFSTLFSSLMLAVILPQSFWIGVAMVTIGSLLCWWSTRDKKQTGQQETSPTRQYPDIQHKERIKNSV